MSTELGPEDTDVLKSSIAGDVILPGDDGYDDARAAWNLVADQHPAVVVMPESAEDIAATVRFAAERGLHVAPQGTGHGAASVPDLGSAILLQTSRMTDVAIDPNAKTARAGAGAQWKHVVGPAAEHGLAALHGSAKTVGVVGYHAGGGHAWVGRSEGWACNNVRSFEAVTAAGEIVTASADSEPDLFWALRGGGGAHAIVTAIEIELIELTEAFAGGLLWDIELAADISRAWRDITRGAPDALASTLKLVRFPPFPELPEPIRGKAFVGVTFAFRGSEADGRELIAPLLAVADPAIDQTGVVPAAALSEIAGDPEDPVPGLGFSAALDSFEDDAIDAYVELAGPGVDVPLIHLEVRHLGGALAQSDPSNGALDAIDSPYLLGSIGAVMSPEMGQAVEATFARIEERVKPWTNDRSVLGFAEHRPGWRSSFPASVADRLAQVRDAYDPGKLIVANHDSE